MLDNLTAAVDLALQTQYVKDGIMIAAGVVARSILIATWRAGCWLFTPAEMSAIARGIVDAIASPAVKAGALKDRLLSPDLFIDWRDGRLTCVKWDTSDVLDLLTPAEARAVLKAARARHAALVKDRDARDEAARVKMVEEGRAILAAKLAGEDSHTLPFKTVH